MTPKCAAAEKLARAARALGWTAQVRYSTGQLDYTHKGAPKPKGGHHNVLVAEPVHGAGVYARRGLHRLAAWYVARDTRRTKTGALSWSLDGAVGRRLVGDGYTPTAFSQAFETVVDKRKATGPTTLAQVAAYLAEHGAEPAQPEPTIDPDARPNWRTAA